MTQLALEVSPLARLSRLEEDPTLRHTGARWRAHAEAYPDQTGALDLAESYAVSDEALRVELEASLAEFREKAPGDEAVGYLSWLAAEMAR